ncbi:MAG: dipeptidyl-peptidase 3 family protein, partial [Bryobacteraceae bacterium]
MSLAAATIPDLAELNRMIARFAPVELHADTSKLSAGDQKALAKLLDAARVIDDIFLNQVWSGNAALRAKLAADKSELGEARLHYFDLNKGPWSELDDHAAFLPGVPKKKLPGANFYPEDLTKEVFESFLQSVPTGDREQFTGFFSVIRKGPVGLYRKQDGSRGERRVFPAVPYSVAYKDNLTRAAKLLNEAAALTPNKSLQDFLKLRAKAFLNNDYYDSDVAWMKLDAPIDITIGPYETYMDEIFGYKAAFEAYVTLRDDEETAKLKMFADHLQEIENNLPLDAKFRNPKIGALAPIRVVNQVLATGDGAHGVRTAAFNLPNDERIVQKMGSKRVMLKNVQEAKFSKTLEPIAKRVLAPADQGDLSFNAFFTHILAHEMTHGIGPQNNVRQSLKELHSAIEEAKADATGLFMMQYLFDHKLLTAAEKPLYTTIQASSFRTLRFGVH